VNPPMQDAEMVLVWPDGRAEARAMPGPPPPRYETIKALSVNPATFLGKFQPMPDPCHEKITWCWMGALDGRTHIYTQGAVDPFKILLAEALLRSSTQPNNRGAQP
jgi:hypothetical protein